jgi:hypothetical protein
VTATAFGDQMNNNLAPIKDSVLTWSRLRGVGKSSAAKITVFLPLIGYLIIFNRDVADFLHLASEFAGGADRQFGVAPKLMLVYLGGCSVALGQVIYGVFCPAEVKAYGHETPYVLDAVKVTKDFEYEKLETAIRASAYRSEYARMRDRYECTPGPPMTEEQKAHINNGVLHLYFKLLNNRWWGARWATGVFYLLGSLYVSPCHRLGVFIRVLKIILGVLITNFGCCFKVSMMSLEPHRIIEQDGGPGHVGQRLGIDAGVER